MKDLDDRLTEHLHTQAGHLSITPAALDRVVARGRRRQRRARAAAGAMAAIAAIAGVAGYQASRPDRSSFKVSVGDAPTSEGAATTITTELDHAVPGTSTDGTPAAHAPASVGGGTAPLPQATIGGQGLSWQRKNPKSTIGPIYYGNPGGPVTVDGRLIALSTAPAGSAPAGSNGVFRFDTLYDTTDGIEWAPTAAPSWLSSLGGRGAQLFGVGTAPANIATSLGITEGAPIVGSSTDGGKTWTTAALPVAADPGPRGTRQGVGMGASLVAGPNGILVTQTSYRQAYLPDLVPTGVDTSWGVTTSPAGVSVLAKPANARPDAKVCPSELPVLKAATEMPSNFGIGSDVAAAALGLSPWVCTASGDPASSTYGGYVRLRFDQLGYSVAHTYTWSELGTSWEQLAGTQSVEHSYYSTDGRTFDPVTLPGSPNGRAEIVADADGFLAVTYAQPDPANVQGTVTMTMTTYRSTDGRTWTEGTPTAGVWGGATRPGRLADGRWVMAGQDTGNAPKLLVSADGLDWQQLGLDAVVAAAVGPNMQGNIGTVDVGPTGITAAVFTSPDIVAEHGGVKVSANGITMTITNSRGAVTITDDASGNVLGTASIWGGESTPLLRVDMVPADARAVATVPSTVVCRADSACGVTPQVPEYVVLDPATGAERARFTGTQVDQALAPVNGDQRQWDPRALILTSVDGSSWAVADLTEVAGEPITLVDGIDHFGDKVIVRAQTKRFLYGSNANNAAFAQLALVGTTKG